MRIEAEKEALMGRIWNIDGLNHFGKNMSFTELRIRKNYRSIVIALMVASAVLLTSCAPIESGPPTSNAYMGSDGNGPTPTYSSPYYYESGFGANIYGSYLGEVNYWINAGTAAGVMNCSPVHLAQDITAAKDAAANFNNGLGIGNGWFYFMGGVGADPSFNESTYSTGAATDWGMEQASWATGAISGSVSLGWPVPTQRVLYVDMENSSSGWRGYTTCGNEPSTTLAWHPQWNWDDLLGFADALASFPMTLGGQTYNFKMGVYASPGFWPQVFNCSNNCVSGGPGDMSSAGLYEWTAAWSANLNPGPVVGSSSCSTGWCIGSFSAQFFGNVYPTPSSPFADGAAMWQWCSSNSSSSTATCSSGSSDFDVGAGQGSGYPLVPPYNSA